MKLPIYQIDAFAEKRFEGNPAAVVPLKQWLPDATMQAIAEENNQAETAFFVPESSRYRIRWFTPNKEVKLCGHATLASAYVLFHFLGYEDTSVTFSSLSGDLRVSKKDNLLTLDFPVQPPEACDAPPALIAGLGREPTECLKQEDYIAVFENESDVNDLDPNHEAFKQLDLRGVIATAPAQECDFVVRFFAPKFGIPEDSVTGSAYTQLTPYWANKLNKSSLNAKQISARGGKLQCVLQAERVLISGSAVTYMQGSIEI